MSGKNFFPVNPIGMSIKWKDSCKNLFIFQNSFIINDMLREQLTKTPRLQKEYIKPMGKFKSTITHST